MMRLTFKMLSALTHMMSDSRVVIGVIGQAEDGSKLRGNITKQSVVGWGTSWRRQLLVGP